MPTPVYMVIREVPGSATRGGREDSIEILEVDHDLHLPIDIHTGRSSGVRQHGPMKVRAAFDKATPLMYKAVTDGQVFDEVFLRFYEIDHSGVEREYYTITLGRARVAAVQIDVPQVKMPRNEHLPHMVKYSLVYESITWTFLDGGIEHMDDWTVEKV